MFLQSNKKTNRSKDITKRSIFDSCLTLPNNNKKSNSKKLTKLDQRLKPLDSKNAS